jgi:hypothetical protein
MNTAHLHTLALNLRSIAADLYSGSVRPSDAETIALASIVIEEAGRLLDMRDGAAAIAEAAPATKPTRKRAPKGQGSHRHKFDGADKCACGAERQRAPKGGGPAPGVLPAVGPPPNYRAPRPIGDDAPDRFDGGAFGTSGTGDRR